MSKSSGQRKLIPLSFSPSNPDARLVMQALAEQQIAKGQRSAHIWAWAAGYLRGEGQNAVLHHNDPSISEDELDQLLDGF
jgi:hypothetical protein